MAKQVGCPSEAVLELIAGRWKIMVIYWLLQGPRRFNQLQRDLVGISPRTLGRQLKEMERDRLLDRIDYDEVPPRVEYRLTPLGRSLESILAAMHDWSEAHGAALTPRADPAG